jgi:hypothetical protein
MIRDDLAPRIVLDQERDALVIHDVTMLDIGAEVSG